MKDPQQECHGAFKGWCYCCRILEIILPRRMTPNPEHGVEPKGKRHEVLEIFFIMGSVLFSTPPTLEPLSFISMEYERSMVDSV